MVRSVESRNSIPLLRIVSTGLVMSLNCVRRSSVNQCRQMVLVQNLYLCYSADGNNSYELKWLELDWKNLFTNWWWQGDEKVNLLERSFPRGERIVGPMTSPSFPLTPTLRNARSEIYRLCFVQSEKLTKVIIELYTRLTLEVFALIR